MKTTWKIVQLVGTVQVVVTQLARLTIDLPTPLTVTLTFISVQFLNTVQLDLKRLKIALMVLKL